MFRRIYEMILHSYWSKQAFGRPHKWQAGCRKGYSTLSQLAVNEHSSKTDKKISVLLDIKKAFDSVRHSDLIACLAAKGWHPQDIAIIKSLFTSENKLLFVINHSRDTEWLELHCGIFQGSVLSPLLFSLWMDSLANELEKENDSMSPCALLFADDIILKSVTEHHMGKLLSVCEEWSIRMGVEFNVKKCIDLNESASSRFQLYGDHIPTQTTHPYLGIDISRRCISWKTYVQNLADSMTKALNSLKRTGYY